ncbi:MAG: carbohydrate binding family 9 domain-containing protein, partial [Acidobacteria bacterium]|nr:carbohydrate binding family 9 domain-containing protein [Acidobacteriota bacterium]
MVRLFLMMFMFTAIPFPGTGAAAQEQPPAFQAVRAAQPPAIDGEFGDPVWSLAPMITGFTQRDPHEGEAATQKTFVQIAYDDEALYVAARMEDEGAVTSQLGRRDSALESDSFRIFLDPQLDRRSGFHFGVYASNVQYDAVLFNDTNADREWDAVWSSETRITPNGWNAEMRIPLSQLRFPDRSVHTWGVNAQRYVSRLNELSRLVHVATTESGFVSRFARLTGIEGIRPRRTFELLPYAVTRLDRRETVSPLDPFTDRTEHGAQIGLDLK